MRRLSFLQGVSLPPGSSEPSEARTGQVSVPVLKKPRWEVFCQGMATGMPIEQAYENAGFSRNGAEKSARRLRARPEIASRLAELKGQIANGLAEITEVAPLQELLQPEIASQATEIASQKPARKVFVLGNIADRVYRVSVLNDLLERCQLVIAERALDMKDVPGGKSGLLVRKLKVVGGAVTKSTGARGKVLIERTAPEVREEYTFDAALVASIRELTKEAGIEMGQRVEQQAMAIVKPDDEPNFDNVPTETLRKARDLMEQARLMLEYPDPVTEMSAEEIHTQEPEATDDVTAEKS